MCVYTVCVCLLAIVMHTIDSPRLLLPSNWPSSTEDVNSEAIEASEAFEQRFHTIMSSCYHPTRH